MAEGAVFPIFIKTVSDDAGRGFEAFNQALSSSLNKARRETEVSVGEIQCIIDAAFTGNDFGTGSLKQSAVAAEARARSARQLATALQAEAAETGNYSAANQVAIATTQRLAAEQERAAITARLSADAMDRANSVAQRHGIAIAANTVQTRAQTQANVMLGQQLMDVAIQAQLGVNPLIILTQQGSQAAYAFTGATGKVGAFARAISNPFAAAVLIGVSVLAQLVGQTEETADALEKVKFSSDAVGSAQGILGSVIDITTGKFKAQRAELVALALAQVKVAQIQAKARADTLRGEVTALQKPTTEFGGGLGGGFSIARKPAGARGAISAELLASTINSDQAIQRMDNLRKVGVLTDVAFAEAAKSIASLGMELANAKTYEAAERLLRGVGTGGDKSLLLRPAKPKSNPAVGRASRLAEFGSDTRDTVMAMNREWDIQPRLIDRAGNALAKLDDLTEDLRERQPKGWKETLGIIEQTRDVIATGLSRPYEDLLTQQREQITLGELALNGRHDEAEAVSLILGLQKQMGPIDEQRRQAIVNNVEALRLQGAAMDKLRAEQQAYLSATQGVQSAIRQGLGDLRTQGAGALKGFVSNIQGTFDSLLANVVTENLFGDIFRQLDNEIRAANGIKTASEIVNDALGQLAIKAEATGNALAAVANQAAGGDKVAANDNSASAAVNDIIVTGRRGLPTNPADFMGLTFTRALSRIFPEDFAKDIGKAVGTAVEGASFGEMAGGMLFGSGGSKAGSAIGGALGNVAGKELAKGAFGAALGKFSSALGPLGSIAGGLLGSVVGGMLTKTPRASANIGMGADGRLTVTGVTSNKKSLNEAAEKSGNAVLDSVQNIAEALGGKVDAARGSVSIGISGDSYHVDPTGQGRLKKSQGGFDFNDDYAAAVKFATMDLIKDGVITGLRASTQRLLQNAKDMDAAIQKATSFESVFTRLKEIRDPVGAALDELHKEFSRLKGVFGEASASAAEFADLEALYGIKRAEAIREAGESVTASLKGLFDDLTTNNDALSLRTRKGAAQAKYDGLAVRVAAGDTSAYDDFSDAARTLLDIQRQISGSTNEYFNLLDQVTGLTKTRIDAETNVLSIAERRPALFGTTSGDSSAPIISATEAQTRILGNGQTVQTQFLSAMSDNIGRLVRSVDALQARPSSIGFARTGTDNF